MTESSFEQKPPKTELPSAEEYRQMGAELYKVIYKVESNNYVYNPGRELLLLELTMVFNKLQEKRTKQAILAELDLNKTNLATLDPQKVINSAQAEYEKSKRTPEDDAKRWGRVFYAVPLWAVNQAMGAYKLIQDRGLNRPEEPLRFSEKKLETPARDFPNIDSSKNN